MTIRTPHPLLALLTGCLLASAACSSPAPQADIVFAAPADARATFPKFERVLQLETTSETSANVSIGDVNGDGHLDLVLAKGRHWPLVDRVLLGDDPDPKLVYLNDGKGHFHVGSKFGHAEWETRHASVADLNGDGWPDIIAANRVSKGAPANYVCLNRGHGRFDADCLPFSHEPATTIAAADFNRDGRIDLAVPHRDGGQSYV